MNPTEQIASLLEQELMRCRAKNSAFSMRALARKFKLTPSAISELLNGKRRITPKMAARIVHGLELEPEAARQILSQVSPPKRNRISNEVFKQQVDDKGLLLLTMDQFHVLADWQYFAVLVLAETNDFRDDPKWIAKRLNITIPAAKAALERLERMQLLTRDANDHLIHSGHGVRTTTDIANVALKKSHHQNLDLARTSLDRDDVLERDFTSITVATSAKKMEEAKKIIKKFRRALWKFLEDGEKEDVYQLNVQFFPLTKSGKTKVKFHVPK